GQPISRANDVEALRGRAKFVVLRLHLFYNRIRGLIWMKRIGDWAFEGLVVFGKRSLSESAERREQAADALGVHYERSHVVLRVRVRFEIGNVIAHPPARGFVPPDLFAR